MMTDGASIEFPLPPPSPPNDAHVYVVDHIHEELSRDQPMIIAHPFGERLSPRLRGTETSQDE